MVSYTIRITDDNFQYLDAMCKKHNTNMNLLMTDIVRIIKSNEAFLFNDSSSNILDASNLVELFSKRIVKENNRILGFYLRNEKVVKSMHRDMLYFLDYNQKDKLKAHPFWVEYDQILELFFKYVYKKYEFKSEKDLIDDMKKYLTINEVEDFVYSLNRTRNRDLSIIK